MPQKISTKKWPKNDLKLPQIAQKLPKIAQIGPKMTQNCQNGPKMTQNYPKISTNLKKDQTKYLFPIESNIFSFATMPLFCLCSNNKKISIFPPCLCFAFVPIIKAFFHLAFQDHRLTGITQVTGRSQVHLFRAIWLKRDNCNVSIRFWLKKNLLNTGTNKTLTT